ncbi:protein kinase domain-containing protein [Enhygromyxa salina]|uniref:protein kinase domain-containing protein n=1 Tax=Enhygromyxa salina TaxID=215803 RepID=UPI0004E67810|nr:protein kinase [Enhygromyxa salina]
MDDSRTRSNLVVATDGTQERQYQTLRVLGTGASGKVFLALRLPSTQREDCSAEDTRKVAIKLASTPQWAGHLAQEARLLRALQEQIAEALEHSGGQTYRIVRIGTGHEPWEVEDVYSSRLIELEYLDGKTMREWFEEDWCRRGDIDGAEILAEVLDCAGQLAEALLQLEVCGDDGLVHRDIKPENIMRSSVGLRLFDFNVAKENGETLKTAFVGTPGYRAPEIMRGEDRLAYDARVDLYSLGVILWEIVHRRRFEQHLHMPKRDGSAKLEWPTTEISALAADIAADLTELIPALVCELDDRIVSARALSHRVATLRQRRRPQPQVDQFAGLGDCDMIQLLSELRPSGLISVVTDNSGQAPRQPLQDYLRTRMQIDDPLEDWLHDELCATASVDRSEPVLFVLAGNAGDGKSHLLKRVLSERLANRPEITGQIRAISDATHALSANGTQEDRLSEFFAPFRDVEASDSKKVHIIAMNTGMVLRFFDGQESHGGYFGSLYSELQRQLGLRRHDASAPACRWRVEVVNLDLRDLLSTDGRESSFAGGMITRLNPDDPESIPGPKWGECKECPAFAHCPVAFNMRSLALQMPRDAVLATLHRVALASGVHLSPRNLWAFFYRLLTGGTERYESSEGTPLAPCDVVRARVQDHDGEWLLAGQFTELMFQHPGAGEPWTSLAEHDPAFSSVKELDKLHTSLAIKPELDNSPRVIKDLAGEGQSVAGLDLGTLGAWMPEDSSFKGCRRDAAVRRHAMFHADTFKTWFEFEGASDFEALLTAYRAFSTNPATVDGDDRDRLSRLGELVQEVFLRGNGRYIDDKRYLQVSQPNTRGHSQLLVHADETELRRVFNIREILRPDIHIAAHQERQNLLKLLGYRPRQITLDIVRLRLTVDLELHDFLNRVKEGQRPSIRDLAQFQALLFIGDRVGNEIATGGRSTHELYVWRGDENRLYRLYRDAFDYPKITRAN